MIDRRSLLLAAAATVATRQVTATARAAGGPFPRGFLWGAATAGHQIEGNNVNSDIWLLEQVAPTIYAEPSGDAVNSFELWPQDLDLVKGLGLNCYRFSLEWARIEPEPGQYSIAMLNHYKAIIDGCRARGLLPMVTFNHFTAPRWFAARGGWTNSQAPQLFAAFCRRAAEHLASGISHATTFNEPNLLRLLRVAGFPPELFARQRDMLAAAARACGTPRYVTITSVNPEDTEAMQPIMIDGHHAARAAIKAVRPDLPVGVSLAMSDDQAAGADSVRDRMRTELYGSWLEAAKGDDFIGVQNYARVRYDAKGPLPPPEGAERNWMGAEIYAPSLAGAVRYAHAATKLPVIVTEHGVGTDDDTQRARLIPAALTHLKQAMDEGVPVRGYVHWTLLDNFEWIFGYKPHFGLATVDRRTFTRSLKPSADVLGAIARRNAL
jgi:beta-glucosidase